MKRPEQRITRDTNSHRRERRWCSRPRRLGILVLCLLCGALTSCDTYDLSGMLLGGAGHGTAGGALAVSPPSAVVVVSTSCTFMASGGTPPYRFLVMSPAAGTIDQGTGVYTAPSVPSSDTIRVSDAAGATADARAISVY